MDNRTKSRHVVEIRQILGHQLEQLWLSDEARNRAVTHVTHVEHVDDMMDVQPGELMVLTMSTSPEHCALEILERGAGVPAALLLSPLALSEPELRRVRELAVHGRVAVGMLAPDVDPRSTINVLSRAVVTSLGSIDVARLHTAHTLQSLAETLGRLIGNSVTIESPSHEVFPTSPTGSDVDQHRVDTI